MKHKSIGAFTLIELLIVIAIIAILGSATVLVLNPLELMRQGRDGIRVSDIKVMEKAIGLYQMDNQISATSNKVYVSIPDTSATCANIAGLPPLPTGWTYNCVTDANKNKIDGTGWIPINFTLTKGGTPLASLPIDSINTSSSEYYSFVSSGNSWKIASVPESVKLSSFKYTSTNDASLAQGIFPSGWIRTPDGFLVMQYEAKYDKNGDGRGDTASAASCPASVGLGLSWAGAGCSTATNIVSTPDGAPIVEITHDQAKAACVSIGSHLITNDEWMKIVRNAEQQSQNWTTGIVGSGCLFTGNTGDGTCGYDGTDPEYGSSRNQRAMLSLSNGVKVYDFSGNVWEHVQKDSSDTLVLNQPTDGGAVGWRWIEHTGITSYGNLSYNEIRPSVSSWNATQGMGRVYTYNGSDGLSHVLLRGGYWVTGSYAGAFALSLGWVPSSSNYNVGFRCAR